MKKIYLLMSFLVFAVTVSAQKPFDYLMKGRALIDQGKYDEAIIQLSQAVKSPADNQVMLMRSEAYLAKGDYSAAINDLNSANSIEPLSGEYGLARIYGLKGDAATSVYHLELSMKSDYRKSEKEIMLDPSFSLIEGRPEWRQFWKKEWYGNLEKGITEIEYNISIGNIPDARSVLDRLSSDYPGENLLLYGDALVSSAETKYDNALKAINSLLAEEPGNEKYLRLLARTQEATGNMVGASSTYTRMLDIGIADPQLLLQRAQCYRKTGEANRALEDINRFLDLYSGNKEALSLAGKIESAEGDNIRALEYFSMNLKLHPNDPECYIDRANSYFISRSWDLAIKDYSMSLDLQPGNSEVWLNKGISLLNAGKTVDACFDFRRSFSLGNRKATEYLSRNCIK